MKKRIILPILTLAIASAAAGAGNHAVFADSTAENEDRVWSLDEAKAIYEEVDAERAEICIDDYECRWEFLDNMYSQGAKYKIANTYANASFMITAINPEQNALKAIFRDQDLNRWDPEEPEMRRVLTELYLCWLDPDFEVRLFTSTIRRGIENDGLHPIARIVSSVNGSSWFPANVEVEISSPEANFMNDAKNTIYFSAWMNSGSFTNSSDYSDCVNSPDYTPGTECRIAFKSSGGYTYLPFKEETSAPAQTDSTSTQDGSEPAPASTGSSTDTPSIDATIEQGGSSASAQATASPQPATVTVEKVIYRDSSATTPPASSKNETDDNQSGATTVEPLAAQAVELPSSGNKEEVIFPWWFIILVVAVDMAIMWFFWPKNRQKIKK